MLLKFDKLIALIYSVAGGFLLWSGLAVSGDVSDVADEVTVTGTVIKRATVFEDVIKKSLSFDEIAALQPSTVLDLLQLIPGLDVSQQGGPGGLTFVSIRGGDPNFTVVMVDGVKVDDPTNSRGGGFDFAGLDPMMIESIDVFYGSHSAVYGSDALGGVISVTTKSTSTVLRGSGSLEVGTDDAWAGAANISGALSNSVGGSLSAVNRQGNEAVEGDSIKRQQVSAKLTGRHNFENELDWGLNFFVSNADATAFPIASGGDQLAIIRAAEERQFEQYVAGGRIGGLARENWQINLAAGWAYYEEENDSPGIAAGVLTGVPPVTTNSDYERANVTLYNTFNLTNSFLLGIGAEGIHEKGTIDSVIDFGFPVPASFSKSRDTWSIFAEVAVDVTEQFKLLGSVRHDDVENIDSTNARIVANMDFIRARTSTALSYAEGFKVPSLFALGHSLTGNPNLKSETSKSYSLYVRQPVAGQDASVSMTFYYNKFNNLVDFDAATFSHVNRARATAKGVDLSVQAALGSKLQFTGRVGYLDTKVNDGTRLERRPKWKGGATMQWKPDEKWLVTIQSHVRGEFYDSAIPTGGLLLDGFARIDAVIRWKATGKIDLKLNIDNIFDNSYEEVVGFSNPGVQVNFSVSGQL